MRMLLGAAMLLALAVGASPAMAQVGSGVYLRIDAGGAFAPDVTFPNTPVGLSYHDDAGKSYLGSAGIGVRLSPVFRIDLTASYMPQFRFSGQDNLGAGTTASAKIKPLVGLLNGYVDFGGLAGFPASSPQPYVVASLGAARNQLDNFTITSSSATLATISGKTTTHVAWGIGAGIGFPLGRFVTFDLMYKYLNLGHVQSSNIVDFGAGAVQATAITEQLQVHTVTAGFRFGF